MNEDEAEAIMFANLRGSKKKPSGLLVVAEASRFFVKKLGSQEKVSEYFKVSRPMISQIDRLNDMSSDAKQLLDAAGIDRSYQVSRLPLKIQAAVLGNVLDMRANPDVRLFVDFLLENIDTPLLVAKRKFLELYPETEKVHIVAIPLTTDTYNAIKKIASRENMIVHDLILKLIEEHIKNAT